ncbi:MAG: cyclic nucleotide-binding domain-containing protein [Betaproteobacteria bacterium]
MFAIVQGRVKISAFSKDGKEVIFAILESGDFFGGDGASGWKVPKCDLYRQRIGISTAMPEASPHLLSIVNHIFPPDFRIASPDLH